MKTFQLRHLSCLLVYWYSIFEISELFPWSIFIGFHILEYWLFLSEIFALLVWIVCRTGSEKCCQLFLLKMDKMLNVYCDVLAFSGPLLKCIASNPLGHVQFIFWYHKPFFSLFAFIFFSEKEGDFSCDTETGNK